MRYPLVLSLVGLLLAPAVVASAQALNVVVIMTDDQRWDSMFAMPITVERLGGRGVTFINAFVTTPLCCPVRASFLSGGFSAHQTGVLNNHEPQGSATMFNHFFTLPLTLQRSGYRTGLIGKYMNGYRYLLPAVPPGWSLWADPTSTPWSGTVENFVRSWWNYYVHTGSSGELPGRAEAALHTQYLTDYVGDESVRFLDGAEPFFLLAAFPAPHEPAPPLPEDESAYSDFTYTGRAYGESDLSTKPRWVQLAAEKFTRVELLKQEVARKQLRTLLSTDRAIGRILDGLDARGLTGRTLVIFTSDNGMLWGEHRLFGKGPAYEESIRVPLIVALPGGVQGGTVSPMVAMNLDIPATIIEATGVSHPTEGLSLLGHLRGDSVVPEHTALILQHWSDLGREIPGEWAWSAIRTSDWKYIESDDGGRELYDMRNDAYEVTNLYTSAAHQEIVASLIAPLYARRGLTMTVVRLPPARLLRRYRHQLTAAGGRTPYHWRVASGQLPPGVKLTLEGLIDGKARETGTYTVSIRVTDESVRTQAIGPQTFVRDFTVVVGP